MQQMLTNSERADYVAAILNCLEFPFRLVDQLFESRDS